VSEHHDEHLDLCAGLALGNLDVADRERLEAHLAGGCPKCEAALAEYTTAVTYFAAAAPAVEPPPALRDRVLQAARQSLAPEAPRVRPIPIDAGRDTRSSGWLWGRVAAAACLALALWGWRDASRLRSELRATQTQIAALESQRADLEERLAAEKRWVSVVSAADARVAALAPTPDGDPAVRARAIVDPHANRAVVAFSNLHVPSGRDYQLWAIRDGKPRSLGLVHADAAGNAVLQLELPDAAAVQAIAVSLEPTGGAPTADAPTGPVVLVGAMGG
jgi:anti-sigma-K factor RskA